VTKMAIFMKGADLFLYMEVEDYADAIRLLNKSPAVLRWEEYMAPIMEDSGDHVFDPAHPYPASLPEVFFWEPSELHAEVRNSRVEAAETLPLSAPHINLSPESSVSRDAV